MAEALTMRRGLLQMLELFQEGTIEHVLVTTFNFDPGFFERNVLPLFCNQTLDDLKSKSLSALAVAMHEPLKATRVVVAYDQGVLAGMSGGGLRYSILPRHLPGGFFHAKIVVLLGKNKQGESIGTILVGSGNMTLSGWANNVEVAGWAPLNKRNAAELVGFYQYLDAPDELDPALAILSGISAQHQGPTLFMQYPTHPGGYLFDRVFSPALFGEIRVFSPYWSAKAVRTFASRGKVFCYPAKSRTGYQFPIPHDLLDQDKLTIEVGSLKGEDRYQHAKAYFWSKYVAIGSANCTMQALHTKINVEAMLRFEGGNFQLPQVVPLKQWATESDDEEGIKPAPLGVLVIANYEKRNYKVDIDVSDSKRCSAWTLSIGSLRVHGVGEQRRQIRFESNMPVARVFRIEWQGCDGQGYMIGMIIPRGGSDVELGFRPKRNLSRIFDDMLRHRPAVSVAAGNKGGQDAANEASDDLTDDSGGDAPVEFDDTFEFDMYGMYQSFFHLRKDLELAKSSPHLSVKEDEIAETLLEILQALKDKEVTNDLQRWLIVQECVELAKQLPRQERFKLFADLATELDANLKKVLLDDAVLGRYKIRPDNLVSWVRKELKYDS